VFATACADGRVQLFDLRNRFGYRAR